MNEVKFLKVDDEYVGMRLDKFISAYDNINRTMAQKIIDSQKATKGDKILQKSYKVKAGDVIRLELLPVQTLEVTPEDIPIEIFYEDEDLLIINKQQGMVVHPANGNFSGTLVNALLYHRINNLSTINGVVRPGIVHRIDKNTSGLLIVAKNDYSHQRLAEQIKEHSFSREYEAVVWGRLKESKGIIDEPIGRHPIDRKRMAVVYKNSKNAKTEYKVLKEYNKFSHLRLKLFTGRTHQIRVHMSHIHHPIVGDDVYAPNKETFGLKGQCLHAKYIGFVHPRTNKYMEFESDLPEYFKEFLSYLEKLGG